MIKNTAGQKIGAQLVSATDGSAFTGSVTAYVCGDAGTQAAGSVGSGACTHEGNGYHTYAPAQAETNYDLVAFTFAGSGAVPTTVQVFTVGGALAQQASVDDLETRLTATRAGYLDNLSAGAVALDSTVAKDATVMKAASYTAPLDAAGTRTAVGLATANLDTQLSDLPTNAELTSALAAADDAVLAAIAALNNLSSAGAQAAASAALTAYNAAVVGSAMTLTAAYDAAKTAASAADVNAQVVDVLRVDLLPDSYAAHEAQPTIAQAILAIHQFLMEREVSSTTMTVQKPNGTSTVMTLTLDSATAPTTVHRSA